MGMKVFTDTDSQFLSRVFQPTASSLKMEPTQTTASNLQTTVNQDSASLLNATVKQTVAANLQTTANQASASLLNATIFQTAASNLHVTLTQTTASNLQTTLADRDTRDVQSTVAVTNTTFSSLPQQNIITLSQFAILLQGGTAAATVKLQVSPLGGTASANWVDNSTEVFTVAANTITILTPTKFSKYVRLQYRQSGTVSSSLNVFYQGHV